MKTNKSYKKRLKISKNGKITARKAGQNHFNAKMSGKKRTARKKAVSLKFTNKIKNRFLNGIK